VEERIGRARERKVAATAAWEVNGHLALSREHELPRVCLKCGARQDVTFRTFALALSSGRPRSDWLALLSVIPGPSFFVSKFEIDRAMLRVPICPACTARWNRARTVLRGLVAIAAAMGLWLLYSPSSGVFFALLEVVGLRLVAGPLLVPTWMLMGGHIAPHYVVVHDVAREARRALLAAPAAPEGGGEGR
jgi:hypothetical protein